MARFSTPSPLARWALWESGAYAVASGALLALCCGAPQLRADPVRDFLYARDCVELGKCHEMGATTSILGLYQGGLWPALIALVGLAGGGARAVQWLVILLQAIAVGGVHRAVSVWVSRGAAGAAAVAYATFLMAARDQVNLWNPSLLALPTVLCAWAVLALVSTRRRPFALLAAFGAAVSMEAHIGAGCSLLPALGVSIVAASPRPSLTFAATTIVVPATLALVSHDALTANFYDLRRAGLLWPSLLAILSCVMLGALLRPYFARAAPHSRLPIVAAFLLAPSALGQAWLRASGKADVELRYLYPAAATGAALIGVLAEASARAVVIRYVARARWVSGVSVLATLLSCPLLVHVVMTRSGGEEEWTFDDLAALTSDGRVSRPFEETKRSIQGPGCWELTNGLGLVAPPPSRAPAPAGDDLLAVKFEDWQTVPEGSFRELVSSPSSRMLFRRIESWLDRRAGQACYEPLEPGGQRECAPLGSDPIEQLPPGDFLFALRSYPALHELRAAGRYVVHYSIPLRPRGDDPYRVLTLTDDDPECPWTFDLTTSGPRRSLRERTLEATDRGEIVFSREFGTERCGHVDRRVTPCFMETRPGDDWLRASVGRSRVRGHHE